MAMLPILAVNNDGSERPLSIRMSKKIDGDAPVLNAEGPATKKINRGAFVPWQRRAFSLRLYHLLVECGSGEELRNSAEARVRGGDIARQVVA